MWADNFRTFPPPCHQQSSMKKKKQTGRPDEEVASGKTGELQALKENCYVINQQNDPVAKMAGDLWWQKKTCGYCLLSLLLFQTPW